MKKKIFAISLIAFGLMSCEREVEGSSSMYVFSKNKDLKSKFLNSEYETGLRTYFDNGKEDGEWGKDWGCGEPLTGNCLNTIVIDLPRTDVKTYNITIQKIVSRNQEEIRNHFYSNEKEISSFLHIDLVQGVIAGELFVTHKGDDSTFVLIFKDKRDDIVIVQPFVK